MLGEPGRIDLKTILTRLAPAQPRRPPNSDETRNENIQSVRADRVTFKPRKNALVRADRPGAGFAAMRMKDILQIYPNPHGENPNPGKPQNKNKVLTAPAFT